ncbi:MAG: SH3 domain-containing protein [Candidatus Binatia bacterium]
MRPSSKAIGLFVLCGFLAGVACGKKETPNEPVGQGITPEESSNPTAFQPIETESGGPVTARPYVTTSNVQLRSGPGPEYSVLTEIQSGTKVNVAGREGEWLKIVSKKGNPPGYINQRDAQPFAESAQMRPEAVEPRGKRPVSRDFVPGSYVTTEETNVRRGPGSNYETVAIIPKDTKVHVVGSEGGWLKVESKHGKAPGYILERHATRSGPGGTRDTARFVPGPYVTTEEVGVRRGPGTNFDVVATIPGDTKINVVDSEGDWLKVQSKHGNPPGYIPARSARRG